MSIRNGIILLALLLGLGLQPAIPTQAAQRCFSETNQCIDGRIREFWEQNGGLAIFGFPIGSEEQSTVDGKTFTVQRFERNRLELHPENTRPYDVLLGRLGADRLAQQGRDWFTFPKNGDTGGCKVFAETGHTVCGAVLNAWRKSGLKLDTRNAVSEAESLALFGLPLSDLQTEIMADGKQYQVQWFERARFELHPENSAPYDVLLGLLGNELLNTSPSEIVQQNITPSTNKPGTQFVPLKTRMVPDDEFTRAGSIRNLGWDVTWRINPIFSDGLNDGSAYIDNSLPYNIVQTYAQSTYLFNSYYDRHYVSIIIKEFTTQQDAQVAYDSIKYTDFYPNADHWNFSDYKGCAEKATVKIFNKEDLGVSGALLCNNRLAIIISQEPSVDMTTTLAINFYGAAWVYLAESLKW